MGYESHYYLKFPFSLKLFYPQNRKYRFTSFGRLDVIITAICVAKKKHLGRWTVYHTHRRIASFIINNMTRSKIQCIYHSCERIIIRENEGTVSHTQYRTSVPGLDVPHSRLRIQIGISIFVTFEERTGWRLLPKILFLFSFGLFVGYSLLSIFTRNTHLLQMGIVSFTVNECSYQLRSLSRVVTEKKKKNGDNQNPTPTSASMRMKQKKSTKNSAIYSFGMIKGQTI